MSHADLIDSLGGGTAIAAALTEATGRSVNREAVYKWRSNGVPWRWRVHVARLAKARGQPLPPDFLGAGADQLTEAVESA